MPARGHSPAARHVPTGRRSRRPCATRAPRTLANGFCPRSTQADPRAHPDRSGCRSLAETCAAPAGDPRERRPKVSSWSDRFLERVPLARCLDILGSLHDQAGSMHPSQCAFCGHDNPVSAKFCNECGSPLHLALCPCGAINEVTDTRCHECGAPLEPARAAVPAADVEDRVGQVEARLQALERHLQDLAEPDHGRAPSGEPVGNKNPAPRQAFASSEGPGGDSPRADTRPSAGEPRGFAGKPTGPGAQAAALPVRHPRFAAIAILIAVALAAAGGAYLHQLEQSLSRPTATAATGTAGVAPQAELVGTTTTNEGARPPLDETPQEKAPVSSNVGSADGESPAALPASPTASAPQPIPPSTAPGAGPDAPSPPATAAAEVSVQRCPPSVAAMALCDRMASIAGQ